MPRRELSFHTPRREGVQQPRPVRAFTRECVGCSCQCGWEGWEAKESASPGSWQAIADRPWYLKGECDLRTR